MNYSIPTLSPDYTNAQVRMELKKLEQELHESLEAVQRRLDNLEILVRVQEDDWK